MLSEKAFQKVTNRKTKVASYYLDATLFGDYWGWFDKRFYHHTGAVSTWYCLSCPLHWQLVLSLCSIQEGPLVHAHGVMFARWHLAKHL